MPLAFLLALTSLQSPEVLDPRTYSSPSGQYRIWVNPDDKSGATGSFCRLAREGQPVLEKRYPYTLRNVRVADDGTIAGYAYRGKTLDSSELLMVLLRADGSEIIVDRVLRKPIGVLHAPPVPECKGVLLNPVNGKAIFRLTGPRSGETWHSYRLPGGRGDGVVAQKLETGKEYNPWIVRAESVPETPLTLINWWLFDDKGMGAAFTLVDEKGETVWRLDVPGDYATPPPGETKERLRDQMQTAGAILAVGPSRFELRHVAREQRVTYRISRSGEKWIVGSSDISIWEPAPGKAPSAAAVSTPIPILEIPPIAKISLPVEPKASTPVRNITDFLLTPKDDLVVLRSGSKSSLALTSPTGKLIREISLPNSAGKSSDDLEEFIAHVGGTKYLYLTSEPLGNGSGKAWVVDVMNGSVDRLADFKEDSIDAVAGLWDGSFAVLSTRDAASSATSQVAYYSPTGKRLWRLGEGGLGGEAGLEGADDVAFDHEGRLLLLDTASNELRWFARNGKFFGRAELGASWPKKPRYLTNVVRDRPGGFVLMEWDGLCRISGDGKLRSRLEPQLAGKSLPIDGEARVDSEGRVWVTNGEAVFRLNERGAVDRTLGDFSTAGGLRSITQLKGDTAGRLYVLDTLSAEVHVFGPKGDRQRVLRPRRSDYRTVPAATTEFQIAPSGDVYCGLDTNGTFIRFDAAGRRVGRTRYRIEGEPSLPEASSPTWRWWTFRLLDERGEIKSTVLRWPNQEWLDMPVRLLSSPDGRAAYFEPKGSRARHPGRLAFYSQTGKPLAQVTVPGEIMHLSATAYTGEYVLFQRQRDVVVVNRRGKAVGRVPLPSTGLTVVASTLGFDAYDTQGTVWRFTLAPNLEAPPQIAAPSG